MLVTDFLKAIQAGTSRVTGVVSMGSGQLRKEAVYAPWKELEASGSGTVFLHELTRLCFDLYMRGWFFS